MPVSDVPLPTFSAALRALQAALDEYDQIACASAGMGRNDWRCLRLLADAGLQGAALSARDIQRALGLTSGSVTALLDRLEKRGLAARAPDPADRRALRISARDSALAMLADADAPLSETLARLDARLGRGRAAELARQISNCAALVEWASRRHSSG